MTRKKLNRMVLTKRTRQDLIQKVKTVLRALHDLQVYNSLELEPET